LRFKSSGGYLYEEEQKMYDYTAGIFVRSKDEEMTKQFLDKGDFLIKFNDAWLGKLSTADLSMSHDEYTKSTWDLSEYIPLLHIVSLEGHGFTIRILHDRKVKFTFNTPFALEEMMFLVVGFDFYGDEYMEYVMKRFTTGIKNAKIDEKVNKEAKKRMQKPDFSQKVFAELDRETLKEFKLFGFSEDICRKLSNILSVGNFQRKGYKPELIILEFLACLELDNLNFVEHNYVLKEKFSFDVIAHGEKYTKRF